MRLEFESWVECVGLDYNFVDEDWASGGRISTLMLRVLLWCFPREKNSGRAFEVNLPQGQNLVA